MTTHFGDDSIAAPPETMRGRDWPCLRQFCVFSENRVGALHEVMRCIEGHDIRVVAVSIVDSIDFAVLRIMLDQYERGRELLEFSKFTFFENDVIGVELPDDPQPIVSICIALLQAEISINYSYPLLYRRHGHGAIALHVDDLETGMATLQQKGLKIITERDLLDDDAGF